MKMVPLALTRISSSPTTRCSGAVSSELSLLSQIAIETMSPGAMIWLRDPALAVIQFSSGSPVTGHSASVGRKARVTG